jgi:hypothetical protein
VSGIQIADSFAAQRKVWNSCNVLTLPDRQT